MNWDMVCLCGLIDTDRFAVRNGDYPLKVGDMLGLEVVLAERDTTNPGVTVAITLSG